MATVTATSPHDWVAQAAQPAGPKQVDRSRAAVFLLAGYVSFLFFYGLSAGEFYRTESLRAIIAAEFLRSGDWIVPRLYGEPFLTKPPGMYAAIALASLPGGQVREWTARLPSVLAGSLLLLFFYGTFRRALSRGAGLIVVAIMPLSLMWLDKVPSAEIDMLQVAWVSAAILCFLRALESAENTSRTGATRPDQRSERLWWLTALLCVTGGTLTKWTAPAFFYSTVIALLWWRGRLRLLWSRPHLLGVAVCTSFCLAWIAAAIAGAGWEAFRETMRREALMHLVPQHHRGGYSWAASLSHPVLLWSAALPGSLPMLWALRPGFARLWEERGRRLVQCLHCWIWPNLVFWSLIPGHSPRHSFPLVPGAVGLSALVWYAWMTGRIRWPLASWHGCTPKRTLMVALASWLLVKLAFVHVIIPARLHGRDSRDTGAQIQSLVPVEETLYLCRLKDEGILFYFGQRTRRLPVLVPPCTKDVRYAILDESEWQQWASLPTVECLARLRDEQGAPIFLIRMHPEHGNGDSSRGREDLERQ